MFADIKARGLGRVAILQHQDADRGRLARTLPGRGLRRRQSRLRQAPYVETSPQLATRALSSSNQFSTTCTSVPTGSTSALAAGSWMLVATDPSGRTS